MKLWVFATLLYLVSGEPLLEKVPEPMPPADGNLHVWALPIGQGDANVIQCPSGDLALWDFGTSNDPPTRFWSEVELKSFLTGHEGLIKTVVITHQHWDHYSKLLGTLDNPAALTGLTDIYISCTENDLASQFSDWVTLINGFPLLRKFNNGGPCGPLGGSSPATGSCGNMDICPRDLGVTMEIMAANLGQHCIDGGNKNMDSIVGKITYGQTTILMPGDFEDETSDWGEDGPQQWMWDWYGLQMTVDINHVSHHGAENLANKPVWRDATAPSFIWSSGEFVYGYGHPRCGVFDAYIQFVGSLCLPPTCPEYLSPDYPYLEILQTTYTCGEDSSVPRLVTDNTYAIFTTVPDTSRINIIKSTSDGMLFGVYSYDVTGL